MLLGGLFVVAKFVRDADPDRSKKDSISENAPFRV